MTRRTPAGGLEDAVRYDWMFVQPGMAPTGAVIYDHPLVVEMAKREFARLAKVAKMTLAEMAEYHEINLNILHDSPVLCEARRGITPEELVARLQREIDRAAEIVAKHGPTPERTTLCLLPVYYS